MKLTTDAVTRQCPLVWMIYMQYCALYENDDKYKDVFHMAIENCPWVKVSARDVIVRVYVYYVMLTCPSQVERAYPFRQRGYCYSLCFCRFYTWKERKLFWIRCRKFKI